MRIFGRRRHLARPRPARGDGPRLGPPPHDTTPRWGAVGIHGIPRPRAWDAVVVVSAPALSGSEHRFVALRDGGLLAGDGSPPGLDVLASALDAELERPFRVEAVRQDAERWAAAASSVEVVELAPELRGSELLLTRNAGESALAVDGMPSFAAVPELERLGAERSAAYVVRALRLDETHWEVEVAPL